jgi:hypothetical protein
MMFTIIAAPLSLCALPNITGGEETKPRATIENQTQSIHDQLDKVDQEVQGIKLTILTLMKAMLDSSSPSEIMEKILQSDDDKEAKRLMALAQCKVDWMNHPAAREDKSSGALSSGDYLAACMGSHGYRVGLPVWRPLIPSRATIQYTMGDTKPLPNAKWIG